MFQSSKRLARLVVPAVLVLGSGFTGIEADLAAQEFAWQIEAPPVLHDNEQFDVAFLLDSREVPSGEPGVDGWQMGAGHEGLELVEVGFGDTDLTPHLSSGFFSVEPTTGVDNEGLVAAVVLSLGEEPVTLPVEGASLVLRATYRVRRSGCFLGSAIEIRDGLRLHGEPIQNRISQAGLSFSPLPARVEFPACEPPGYTLSLVPSESPLELHPLRRAEIEVGVRLEQTVSSARSWSLALVAEPLDLLELLEVTIEGTGLEEHRTESGFVSVERTRGAGNEGLIIQVDLSPEVPWSLPELVQPLLRVRFRLPLTPEIPAEVEHLRFQLRDSLRGAGGRVETRVLPEGLQQVQGGLQVRLDRSASLPFIRGDANGDSRVDISDPLLILGYLFLGDPSRCQEAMDVDAGGLVDLADAVGLLIFQFLDGLPPRAPYPGCGEEYRTFDCQITGCAP